MYTFQKPITSSCYSTQWLVYGTHIFRLEIKYTHHIVIILLLLLFYLFHFSSRCPMGHYLQFRKRMHSQQRVIMEAQERIFLFVC